jgi:hypothetical protein
LRSRVLVAAALAVVAAGVAILVAAHGLRWMPIVDYAPAWATGRRGHALPVSDSRFAGFGGALAARYGEGGAFWRMHPELTPQPVNTYEIWNEPDNRGFAAPAPDPAAYAALYRGPGRDRLGAARGAGPTWAH